MKQDAIGRAESDELLNATASAPNSASSPPADRYQGRIGNSLIAGRCDGQVTENGLERMLVAYGTLTLSEQSVAIHRLVISESGKFPEIGSAFHEMAIRRANEGIAAWLCRQCERRLIMLDDPSTAAGMLRGMMAMDPQRAVMLGQRVIPDQEEIATRARQCAHLFLNGCAVR